MLDAAVLGEIEDRVLAEPGGVEIAGMNQQFVRLGSGLDDDLAVGIDDQAATEQGVAVLDAGLRNADDPGRILVGPGLQREPIVEHPLLECFHALLGIGRGRVVTDQNHLDALQPHHAIGLRPAPVVADRHAENAAEHTPDIEAEIAGLEVTLLQMLEGAFGIELRMTRQMNLAVLSDNLTGFIGEDAGVEMVPVRRQFGIAKVHGDLVVRGALKKRLGRHIWHLAFEPGIDLGLILHIPARKERGECEFRIDDQIGALRLGFIHQRYHALDDRFAAVGFLDRSQLGGSNNDDAHGQLPKYFYGHVARNEAACGQAEFGVISCSISS